MSLEWVKGDEYHIRSGQYTIDRYYDADGTWRFESWHGQTLLRSRLSSADEAKALCEAHYSTPEQAGLL